MEDRCGYRARTLSLRDFEANGYSAIPRLVELIVTRHRGSIRGLWNGEEKLIQCVVSVAFVTLVDLRPESATYRRWHGYVLSQANKSMLYVPSGCALGYQAMDDNCEVLVHKMAHEKAGRGLRYDDPVIGIAWPLAVTDVSADDAALPYLGAQHDTPGDKQASNHNEPARAVAD